MVGGCVLKVTGFEWVIILQWAVGNLEFARLWSVSPRPSSIINPLWSIDLQTFHTIKNVEWVGNLLYKPM